jgi:hypothetical protein
METATSTAMIAAVMAPAAVTTAIAITASEVADIKPGVIAVARSIVSRVVIAAAAVRVVQAAKAVAVTAAIVSLVSWISRVSSTADADAHRNARFGWSCRNRTGGGRQYRGTQSNI